MPATAQKLKIAADPQVSRVVTITPEWASALLAKNTRNRRVSDLTVDAYARDMAAGRWLLNGAAICIRADRSLADGQHRLLACVKAGVPFESFFIEGLSDDAALTIDGGRKRTMGDKFGIVGELSGNALAATIRQLYIFATWDYAGKLTDAEMVSVLEKHPQVRNSLSAVRDTPLGQPSIFSAIHYIGGVVQGLPAEADAFSQVFVSGTPSYEGDPAHLLRERLLKAKLRGMSLNRSAKTNLLAHAWNNFAERRALTVLKAPDQPVLKGWNEEVLFGGAAP